MLEQKGVILAKKKQPVLCESLSSAIDAINKRYGNGTARVLGGEVLEPPDIISSGSIGLDIALGIGGLPRGRIIEIFGPESAGKTTLALNAIAQAQQKGLKAAFVDAEHSLDLSYAKALGIDIDRLCCVQPSCGEEALDATEILISQGGVDLVVVDSVAALTPMAVVRGEVGDSHVGVQARMMSQSLPRIIGRQLVNNATVVFVNQIRMKIGVMFGNPETTPGGNALKFYSSVRLEIRVRSKIKDDGEGFCGNRTKVKVAKNKLASPYRTCEFDLIYGSGIDTAAELIEIARDRGIIENKGSWFSYSGSQLGQGIQKAKLAVLEEPKLFEEILSKVKLSER